MKVVIRYTTKIMESSERLAKQISGVEMTGTLLSILTPNLILGLSVLSHELPFIIDTISPILTLSKALNRLTLEALQDNSVVFRETIESPHQYYNNMDTEHTVICSGV
jgi:hypothetical protein